MIVSIWRHGEAGSAASDRLRELTVAGKSDLGRGIARLHRIWLGRDTAIPELLLHSPWVRTTQTAQILAAELEHIDMHALDALGPGSDLAAVDAALTDLSVGAADPQHVVLVSHQPLVSRLVDHYLGDTGSVPPLPPGGVATLELDIPAQGCGRLILWALPPRYEVGV